jgi:Flp pilus assembly protein TadD
MSPVSRPLHTQDNTNTEEALTDIHALSRIRTHDPSALAGENVSCPRRGRYDRRPEMLRAKIAD